MRFAHSDAAVVLTHPVIAMIRIAALIRDERATAAVEYAVMIGLIIGVAFAAISQLGSGNGSSVQNTSTRITTALGS